MFNIPVDCFVCPLPAPQLNQGYKQKNLLLHLAACLYQLYLDKNKAAVFLRKFRSGERNCRSYRWISECTFAISLKRGHASMKDSSFTHFLSQSEFTGLEIRRKKILNASKTASETA